MAQKSREEVAWEYKVAPFSYNPGEPPTDGGAVAFYEKTLNEQAKSGWEPVGSLLSRNVADGRRRRHHPRLGLLQAYRRPKK